MTSSIHARGQRRYKVSPVPDAWVVFIWSTGCCIWAPHWHRKGSFCSEAHAVAALDGFEAGSRLIAP